MIGRWLHLRRPVPRLRLESTFYRDHGPPWTVWIWRCHSASRTACSMLMVAVLVLVDQVCAPSCPQRRAVLSWALPLLVLALHIVVATIGLPPSLSSGPLWASWVQVPWMTWVHLSLVLPILHQHQWALGVGCPECIAGLPVIPTGLAAWLGWCWIPCGSAPVTHWSWGSVRGTFPQCPLLLPVVSGCWPSWGLSGWHRWCTPWTCGCIPQRTRVHRLFFRTLAMSGSRYLPCSDMGRVVVARSYTCTCVFSLWVLLVCTVLWLVASMRLSVGSHPASRASAKWPTIQSHGWERSTQARPCWSRCETLLTPVSGLCSPGLWDWSCPWAWMGPGPVLWTGWHLWWWSPGLVRVPRTAWCAPFWLCWSTGWHFCTRLVWTGPNWLDELWR